MKRSNPWERNSFPFQIGMMILKDVGELKAKAEPTALLEAALRRECAIERRVRIEEAREHQADRPRHVVTVAFELSEIGTYVDDPVFGRPVRHLAHAADHFLHAQIDRLSMGPSERDIGRDHIRQAGHECLVGRIGVCWPTVEKSVDTRIHNPAP
jgi:hypothetical protein